MKKLLSLVLVLVLTFALAIPSYAVFTRPSITSVGDEIQVINAGEKSKYIVKLKNESTLFAKNVELKFSGEHPFLQGSSELTKYVGTLNPNEVKEVVFEVNPTPVAKSQIYEFVGELTYLDGADTNYSNTVKLYVKIDNTKTEPSVGVSKYNLGQAKVKEGKVDSLAIYLKNYGDLDAQNIKIKLDGFAETGLVLSNDGDTKTVKLLKKNQEEMIFFNVKGGKDLESGVKSLTGKITYTDVVGNNYEKAVDFRYEADGKNAEKFGKISNIIAPSSVVAGDDFTISYEFTNTSGKTIEKATFTTEYPANVFISKSGSIVTLNNIAPDETKKVVVKLKANDEATSETYHSTIKFTNHEGKELSEIVSVYVQKKGETEGSKPKLIIDKYSYGDLAMAGEEFDLTLDIKNTSTATGTKNIKVTISSEDSAFIPVDSSSSFFVKNIGPGEIQSHTIRLKTKIEAAVKIYQVTVKMEYEDSKGNSYDSNKNPYAETENLSVAVGQPVRLETGELIYPLTVFPGEEFDVEQEFYNLGKSTMYNLMIEIKGVKIQNNKNFVGNFDAGRSDYYSVRASLTEPGENKVTIVYNFEDALGNKSSIEKEFVITVNDDEVPPIDQIAPPIVEPVIPEDNAEGMNIWLIVGGVVVIILGVGIFLKRRKEKKSAQMEDDDE